MSEVSTGPRGPGRLLGIDYGEARVGLALSDPLGFTAQPLRTLDRRGDKQICREVQAVVEANAVVGVVVGHPLEMTGASGPAAQRAEAFAERLRRYLRVPVTLRDERMTTMQAERALDEGRVSRKRQKAVVDQLAAVLILQAELEARRIARERAEEAGADDPEPEPEG